MSDTSTARTPMRVRDLCIRTTSGGTPSRSRADYYVAQGIPWVKTQELVDCVLHDTQEHISKEALNESSAKLLPAGTILVAMYGATAGQLGVLGRSMACNQACCALLVDPQQCDPRFLYYALRQERGRMKSLANGAAQQNLSVDTISNLEIDVPSRPEQVAIAEVLGALDDKIACNERVHVSANETASALLSKLLASVKEDDTLTEGRLRDVATVNARAVKPGTGEFRYLDISSVGVGHAQQPVILDWFEAPGRARRSVVDGDVLWSTVRPGRKSHWLVLDPPEDLVVSTGFAVLTPISVGPSFLYGITERRQFVEYLVAVAEGSAYPAVRADRFLDAPIPLPPSTAISAYEALTMPLRRRAHAAVQESQVLSRLRDLLLPSLLSGEVRARDPEPLMGNAV